jgi:hypothetical protein
MGKVDQGLTPPRRVLNPEALIASVHQALGHLNKSQTLYVHAKHQILVFQTTGVRTQLLPFVPI